MRKNENAGIYVGILNKNFATKKMINFCKTFLNQTAPQKIFGITFSYCKNSKTSLVEFCWNTILQKFMQKLFCIIIIIKQTLLFCPGALVILFSCKLHDYKIEFGNLLVFWVIYIWMEYIQYYFEFSINPLTKVDCLHYI